MQADELLRELMKNAGLNAADFSRASNMAESVVSRTLSGKTVPTLNKVDAAARTLGYELTLSPLGACDCSRNRPCNE